MVHSKGRITLEIEMRFFFCVEGDQENCMYDSHALFALKLLFFLIRRLESLEYRHEYKKEKIMNRKSSFSFFVSSLSSSESEFLYSESYYFSSLTLFAYWWQPPVFTRT